MHKYFNPGVFTRFADRILVPLVLLTISIFVIGLYYALFNSPPDYQQGEAVRIMYVHVPAAWMALGIYTFLAVASAAALIWKSPLSDIMAVSAAPAGAVYTLICLVTGSLWGKPIWGTWWVWDARLTSVLVLMFFYLGYLGLYHAFNNPQKAAKPCAVLAIVGFVNIPIIKFSVDWWNTLHQPASIFRTEGIAIEGSMLVPLLLMFAAFACLFLVVLIIRVKTGLIRRKTQSRIDKQLALSTG